MDSTTTAARLSPSMSGDEQVSGRGEEAARVIRVAIADDNTVVRMGVRSLLATAGDIELVGEAGTGAAALTLARSARPDVVLLDVRMPQGDGVSVAADIASVSSVVMLTYAESPEVIVAAVKAGACGYLVHGHFGADDLLQAVRLAARGIATFSSQALAVLSNPVPTRAALARRFGLSEREAEVMERVAKGSSNTEIAGEMFLSEKTVKNYINKLFAKMHANNRGHAVSLWLSGP